MSSLILLLLPVAFALVMCGLECVRQLIGGEDDDDEDNSD